MTAQELQELAFQIADQAALSVVECSTLTSEIDGESWLDFALGMKAGEQDWSSCENDVRYLEARGLLHRHPRVPGLVRIEAPGE